MPRCAFRARRRHARSLGAEVVIDWRIEDTKFVGASLSQLFDVAALPRHAGVQHAACGALQRLAEDAEARAALLAVPAPPDGHATDQPADESALAARAAWRGARPRTTLLF